MRALRLLICRSRHSVSFTRGTGCPPLLLFQWFFPLLLGIRGRYAGPGIICIPPLNPRRLFLHPEQTSSLRFLGNPYRTFALLSDPGGSNVPGSYSTSVLLPLLLRRKLPQAPSFEALSHGFCTRCLRFTLRSLYTCKTHFRPVASLYRVGIPPTGLQHEISVFLHLPSIQT